MSDINDYKSSPCAGDVYSCNCGSEIGQLIQVNDSLWLNLGQITVRYGHGRCENCQRIWHFNSSEIQLKLLINHAIMGTTK